MPRTDKVNQQIRDERKEQILRAAAQVFARNGYVGTRIDDIAAAANVSKGLIYHYFDNKEAIFHTLIEGAARGTRSLFERALNEPGSACERMQWLISQEISGLKEEPHVFMVVLQAFVSDAVPQEIREEVSRLADETRAVLAELITTGQREGEFVEGDPACLAFLLGSCMQGLAISAAMSTAWPCPLEAESVMRLVTSPSVSNGFGA